METANPTTTEPITPAAASNPSSTTATSTIPTNPEIQSLPTRIYIILPLIVLTGLVMTSLAVFLFHRQRKRKRADIATLGAIRCDLDTAQIRGGRAHPRGRSTRRWPWARRPLEAASSRGGVVRRESTEGLNELGEPPPPYHAQGLAGESVEDCTAMIIEEVRPVEEFGDGGGCARLARVMIARPLGSSSLPWPPTYEPGLVGLAIPGPSTAPPSYQVVS